MMFGPGAVGNVDKERAGLLMTFFLQAGLLAGSQGAFAFSGPP